MRTLLGIDEAGRGAVVGPLVIGGVVIEETDEKKLKEMGAKDSKLLTPLQREKLEIKIKAVVKDFVLIKISAQQIDEMRAAKKNLNRIEAEKMAEIIKVFGPDTAVVDAPQVSTEKFKAYLLAMAKNHTKIIAENYADKNWPVVSAASILAKVERDREIEQIKKLVGVNFGVGYPHDSRTIEFVKKCLKEKKNLEWIRHSWETVRELKGKKKQKGLTDFTIGKEKEE
ncbi:MAG: ribonuclease HII [Candidatus Aenigmarchaeota archaeon]|nr:ribonuclease HII [Candidatus Aenigmarchaeota archaeon]